MIEAKTLTLRGPVEYGGQTYDKLDLCEPTAGQMEKASTGATGVAYNIILISEVAKVPIGAVRLIKKRDLEDAIDFLRGFQNDAPPTGAAS